MTAATLMNNQELHRHQLIKNLTAQNSEEAADTAIILWEQIASKIISIIGERGFKSLYVRSIFLNSSKFPWLASYNPKSETNNQFTELRICFEMQTHEQIKIANNQLLLSLTDILASLIGEPLTTNILCTAWGDVASNFVSKELKNE